MYRTVQSVDLRCKEIRTRHAKGVPKMALQNPTKKRGKREKALQFQKHVEENKSSTTTKWRKRRIHVDSEW